MNKKLLRAKMMEKGDTQKMLAEALGIDASTLNAKINGKGSFRQNEIAAIRKRYNLSAQEVDRIFFGDELS